MDLEEQYPTLYQFLAGYFPEADYDGLSDQEVVTSYCAETPFDTLLQTERELEWAIGDRSCWRSAGIGANRYFEHENKIGEWLGMLLQELKEQI